MPAGTRWTVPTGGFYIWLTLPDGLHSKDMLPRAIAERVAYVPGTGFYADGTGGAHLRLCYSFPPPERIREGVRRLAAVIEQELALRSAFGVSAGASGPAAVTWTRRPAVRGRHGPPTLPVRRRHDHGYGLESTNRACWCSRVACPTSGTCPSGPAGGSSTRCAPPASTPRSATSTRHFCPSLAADPPDAVVIALHGAAGEDGSLQAILDLCGVPYVGGDAQAARLAWDKPTAKSVLREAGIATPDWVALPQERFTELGAGAVLDRMLSRFGLPLMVKPAQGGSGLGTSVVRDATALATAMVGCFAYHSTALIEPYVSGMDVAVSVVDTGDGPVALPAVEIVAARRRVRLRRPLHRRADHLAHSGPARPGRGRTGSVEVALDAHRALGLRDLSRIDLIVDESGTPYVIEASVAPGMTDTSLLPMSVTAAGLDLGKTLATLVDRAVLRG